MGIAGDESLRATNIKFLNDEHEFQNAINLINEIIPTSRIKPEHQEHAAYKKYIDDIREKLKTLDKFVTESIFTLLFSEETDLLSQWRGYCPDNAGYCVVFDIHKVFEETKAAYQTAHLVNCVYDIETKEGILKDLLNKYWFKHNPCKTDKERKAIIDELGKEVMLQASFFKHSSFSEERERRIVVILDFNNTNLIKFRQGKLAIIPYIDLPAKKEHLKEIIIGPTSAKELTKRSLEMYLEKVFEAPSFIHDCRVAYSKTPYRPW